MVNTLPFSNMLMEYPLERCCDVVAVHKNGFDS